MKETQAKIMKVINEGKGPTDEDLGEMIPPPFS
jgi:hypothetical protein